LKLEVPIKQNIKNDVECIKKLQNEKDYDNMIDIDIDEFAHSRELEGFGSK
jgi:hypothetical protein